jgi:hypothetical protein
MSYVVIRNVCQPETTRNPKVKPKVQLETNRNRWVGPKGQFKTNRNCLVGPKGQLKTNRNRWVGPKGQLEPNRNRKVILIALLNTTSSQMVENRRVRFSTGVATGVSRHITLFYHDKTVYQLFFCKIFRHPWPVVVWFVAMTAVAIARLRLIIASTEQRKWRV